MSSLVDIKWSPFIPHAPEVPQHAFLLLDHILEVFYGGAAGGGKSDALLMAALQYVDVPDYAALLIRRTYADLSMPGAIMDRARQWLAGTGATWNEQKHQWRFPSGAVLAFGHLQTKDAKYNYKSAEFQFIGVDESTEIPEADYTYLFSRLRKPSGINDDHPLARVPLRFRAASNPGGRGAHFHRRRFPVLPGHTPQQHEGRVFIPAKLSDNPHIEQASYRRSLAQLDEQTQAQLLMGDWTARPPGPWTFNHLHLDAAVSLGGIYDDMLEQGMLVPPVGGMLMAGMDFGEAAHMLLGWPLERRGYYVCREHPFSHSEPDIEAVHLIGMADALGLEVDRGRYDSSKPESMRLFVRKARELKGVEYAKPSPIAFNKYKRDSILHVRKLLRRTAMGMTTGILALSPKYCPKLIEQLYDLEFKNEDSEDIVKENDHGPDALFAMVAPETRSHIDTADEAVAA